MAKLMGADRTKRSDAFIVNASSGMEPVRYPNAMQIAHYLIAHNPHTIKIVTGSDVKKNRNWNYRRHIALELATGQLSEIPNALITYSGNEDKRVVSLGAYVRFCDNLDSYKTVHTT